MALRKWTAEYSAQSAGIKYHCSFISTESFNQMNHISLSYVTPHTLCCRLQSRPASLKCNQMKQEVRATRISISEYPQWNINSDSMRLIARKRSIWIWCTTYAFDVNVFPFYGECFHYGPGHNKNGWSPYEYGKKNEESECDTFIQTIWRDFHRYLAKDGGDYVTNKWRRNTLELLGNW